MSPASRPKSRPAAGKSAATPVVSVCIVTYQHARFIGQAIDGALRQRASFPIEILVGEDESTDGTREIALEYGRKHPDQVKVFLRSRKDMVPIDGRPRGGANLRATVRAAQGEFIALCEGDDYWTDPEKLERQVAYLRANPDCVGCFHDAALVDAEGAVLQPSYFQSTREKFTQEDVLGRLMSSYPTCSLVFRRDAFDPLPDWFLRRPCDLYLDIHLTAKGPLGFINRNMAAYRKHAGGIWSSQRQANQIVELIIRYKLLLADPFFLQHYRDLLLQKIDEFQGLLLAPEDVKDELGRLQTIVAEQEELIAVLRREHERLTAEGQHARAEVTRIAASGEKHHADLQSQLRAKVAEGQRTIDDLLAQMKDLAAKGDRRLAEAQGHIDDLKGQLAALATTSKEQGRYIAVLESEQKRLTELEAQRAREIAHYTQVMKEQTAFIATLQDQIKSRPEGQARP